MADDESSLSPSPSRSSSPSTPFSPSPPPISLVQPSSSPPPIVQPSDSVTVASTVPHIALPIQPPPGSNPAGGCREDCWSEGATSALIDAWGERYLLLNRGNLKQKQWQEVADAVISRDDYSKTPKSDIQCKNRIDTLKKKYKIEKSKIAAGTSSASSFWPFFHRLDLLLAPSFKPSASAVKKPKHPPPPPPPLTAFPQKQRTKLSAKRKGVSRPPVSASSSSDSAPPSAAAAAEERRKTAPFGGIKELALSILKFAEVYQRVERSKLEQSMEMERQRMEFSRELEMQRLQFFMKTQMELSHLKRRNGSSGSANDGSNKRQWHSHQSPANNCNNNGKQNGK